MAKGYSARRGFTGGAGMMQQQAQMQQKLLKMQQDMAKVQEEVEKTEFTASVGGGIGWLSELERARRIETVHHVGGIMNGTCNYILDSMTRLGLGYSEALKQAQALGYAEADPTTDVEGINTSQTLTLRHEAHNRSMFADGAVEAARFVLGKPAGLYDMESLLAEEQA